MGIDLQYVDIMAVLHSLEHKTSVKKSATTRGGNYSGRCPKPDCSSRNDGFYILPNDVDKASGLRRGKWACRKCHPNEGDAIDLITHVDGLSTGDAIRKIKEMFPAMETVSTIWQSSRAAGLHNNGKQVTKVRLPSENAVPPSDIWQARAKYILEIAEQRLHEPIGRPALNHLLGRGLTLDTIKAHRLGFIPLGKDGREVREHASKWGVDIDDYSNGLLLASGIVFPYFYKGDVWKLRIRRTGDDVPKDKRYVQVSGSSNGLFNADDVRAGCTVLFQEGEINALSAKQATQGKLACVACGSKTHARIQLWIGRLSIAEQVYLCFDNDTQGEEVAKYWLDRLEGTKQIYLPALVSDNNDMNDLLQAGIDISSHLKKLLPGVSAQEANSTPDYREMQNIADESNIQTPLEVQQALDDGNENTEDNTTEMALWALADVVQSVFGPCEITVEPRGAHRETYAREIIAEDSEPTERERAILACLQNYNVQLAGPCKLCGCRVKWLSIGKLVCARCEPGALWTYHALSLLGLHHESTAEKKLYKSPFKEGELETLHAHYGGGYKGYCEMHRQD